MTLCFLKKFLINVPAIMMITGFPLLASAAGVGLGATRVIYPSQSNQISLSVNNSDPQSAFLVQSWIDTTDGKKSEDFAITPSLFKIKPKAENLLRIAYAGEPLPQDRESLFWLNVKAIPPLDPAQVAGQNSLQLAVVSRIKMFYRPQGLSFNSNAAPALVTVTQSGQQLLFDNPTPYFVNLVKIDVGGISMPNKMVAPHSKAELELPAGAGGAISYSAINDYGAQVKIR